MEEKEAAAVGQVCTICGLKCEDRVAFNAHIRAHLKDKLNNRRELKMQQTASNNASTMQQQPVKRTKLASTSLTSIGHHHHQQLKQVKEVVTLTNIQSLLPSSPLPISKAAKDNYGKPDLEALLSGLQQTQKLASDHPLVMAELAACKPIPPKFQTAASKKSETAPCTPEVSSDMDEDIMSYEMEMNRIDFHNDLASILDQIEKDFESPCLSHDLRLDTPPDSDCEATYVQDTNRFLNTLMASSNNDVIVSSSSLTPDLLGFERFSQRISLDLNHVNEPSLLKTADDDSRNVRLVQSPASVAKVGKLPAKTLAVLNKLPARLFVPAFAKTTQNEPRFVDVVKVERSTTTTSMQPATRSQAHIGGQLLTEGTQCIINIECRQPGESSDEPAKIIQTFRAIDTGSEIKLVPADSPITVMTNGDINAAAVKPEPKLAASSTSYCPVCNKCITNKNMARHLEKHQQKDSLAKKSCQASERKFLCKYCCKAFTQRSHLSRHVKAHTSSKGDLLTCRVCGKACKNRVSLVRHRTKHLSCVHCSSLFENKIALQDHLLKAHPEMAIVSLVQPPTVDTRLDLDDLGSIGSNASHSLDYSFSPPPTVEEEDKSLVGETLADIADANYFYCSSGSDLITDELYTADLFAQTC